MKLTMSAGIPCLTAQQIKMGITVVHKTRSFEQGLGTWNVRPVTENIWLNFKMYFKAARTELKAIRGPTMKKQVSTTTIAYAVIFNNRILKFW